MNGIEFSMLVSEITGKEIFEREWREKVWVISFLPKSEKEDMSDINFYLNTIENFVRRWNLTQFNFLWTEGGTYPDLEKYINPYKSYPSIYAISLQKEQYFSPFSDLTSQSLSYFFERLVSKNFKVSPMISDIEFTVKDP